MLSLEITLELRVQTSVYIINFCHISVSCLFITFIEFFHHAECAGARAYATHIEIDFSFGARGIANSTKKTVVRQVIRFNDSAA